MNELHPYSFKAIFDEGLYIIKEKTESLLDEKAVPEIISLNYLGNNIKKILVVYHSTQSQNLRGEELSFLLKILQAINLSIEDVAICNLEELKKIKIFTNHVEFKILIGFGIKSNQLNIEMQDEKYIIHTINSIQYLWVDDLVKIEKDVEMKKLLWKNMKVLFN